MWTHVMCLHAHCSTYHYVLICAAPICPMSTGVVTLKMSIIPNGIELYGVSNPLYMPGPVEPRYNRQITFQGISVDANGKQLFLDATAAYRMACLNAIEHLKKHGYTGEQAYLLLSASPCDGKLAGMVDVPNACATIGIPIDMFEFDITPSVHGPVRQRNLGQCAVTSDKK
eukprot:TRINITY_DN11404_c0_g1_i3.p3 TRINITY_DN11404_c0_g1~~TRINITY_DN11404_c0_g1_i3.p3  ORF type:complete len:171 (-),score=32.10 TRINITY_DN11404_c0_g1_i3:588-1100(-)